MRGLKKTPILKGADERLRSPFNRGAVDNMSAGTVVKMTPLEYREK